MVCKESDLLIVPKKLVTRVEVRGKHITRSESKTSVTQEVTKKMVNAFEGIVRQTEKHAKAQTVMHYVNKQTLIDEHKRQHSGKATGVADAEKVSQVA